MGLKLRLGEPGDLYRLVEIYNHYVNETHITFDTEPFTAASRTQWFNQFSASGPHRLLVAVVDDQVIGYASSTSFKPKPAYSTSVETAIYLDSGQTGKGFGPQLYAQLLDHLVQEDAVHRAYSGVALPNAGSIALHEGLGFVHVATYHEVGFKLGKYWDVSWYEKDLASP